MLVGGQAYTGFFYVLMSLFGVKIDLGKMRKRRYVVGTMIGLAGMPNSGMSAAQKVLIADSTDYMEWYSERKYGTPLRSDGMLIATGSIVSHLNTLIRKNIKEISLNAVGYERGNPLGQSDRTRKGIYFITTLCGVLGNLLPALVYLCDRFTGSRRKEILAELAEMRERRVAVAAAEIEADVD